ncbi:hypothetical protein MKK70_00790 [Methylobacterium sp. E-041]|uniref:DUF6894 family protein n=1 Tax=Methylobacterium sp. E-041 TaxID=2836573 RepID=UPI001FB87E67|nr:hypothetical protein [Methylobacterium sp. E-041]MCJ2103942.1 hypothetical protein [Methylobacterium sp. E-041]
MMEWKRVAFAMRLVGAPIASHGLPIRSPASRPSETTLPRYFFDIADGDLRIDETGPECADLDAVRSAAMQILPEIARFEIGNGDRHTFTVIARDVGRRPVFTTTLSLTGLWLVDR